MKKRSKDTLSQRKIELYNKNAEIIKFWRRNPVIACEQILGIKLLDSQKYLLQESWTKPYVLWCCSRNFGKSFLGAIFMILKFLLFENQQIYIISSVGKITMTAPPAGDSWSKPRICGKPVNSLRYHSVKMLRTWWQSAGLIRKNPLRDLREATYLSINKLMIKSNPTQ